MVTILYGKSSMKLIKKNNALIVYIDTIFTATSPDLGSNMTSI